MQSMKWLSYLLLVNFLLASASMVHAGGIYRCGNEYTNDAARIAHGGCKPLQGGKVQVVQGAIYHDKKASTRSVTLRNGNHVIRPAQHTASVHAQAVRAPAQSQRNASARAILQTELQKASQRLHELRRQYNHGEPERLASEMYNQQPYIQRVAALRADIQRVESDIAGLQRELRRAGG